MARRKVLPGKTSGPNPWTDLSWDHLDTAFGAPSVRRGRDYQQQGRVTALGTADDGLTLLATVRGTERYSTRVGLTGAPGEPVLRSACTCFIGFQCKHGVATVAAYLDAVASGVSVAAARPDDPRWRELAAVGDEVGADPDDEGSGPARESARRGAVARSIEAFVRERSEPELIGLVLALAERFPIVAEELRERMALAAGDADRFLREVRQAIRRLRSAASGWDDEDGDPDFGRIGDLFNKLLALDRADDVVLLGRDYIPLGLRRAIELSDYSDGADDFSDGADDFAGSLVPIFRAVNRSSLSGGERLIVAIDALLADDYGHVEPAADLVLDGPTTPDDWSEVADTLLARLRDRPPVAPGRPGEDSSAKYDRQRLADWVDRALRAADRADERLAVAEAEARASGHFEPFIDLLIAADRSDEAETWAAEGIARAVDKEPGTANLLARKLVAIAERREDWQVVAAHRSRDFFETPGPATHAALMIAARRAGVEEAVRAVAQHFLETGLGPIRFVAAPGPKVVPKKSTPSAATRARNGRGRVAPAAAGRESAGATDHLAVDAAWPLPVVDALIPLLARPAGHPRSAGAPRFDVLVDLAIAEDRPDAVLHWFDRAAGTPIRDRIGPDRVAAAVAATHPERAIEIYTAVLSQRLVPTGVTAYEAVVATLRKLRPLHDAVGRPGEWTTLVASIRARYASRRLLREHLDRLDGRTIVDEARKRPPRA